MNDTPTPDEMRTAIAPKSDQLNSDDLLTGPITVTITAVRKTGDPKQPFAVEIKGHRPWKPCKTMLRILTAVYSDDGNKWVGTHVTLYRDPEAVYGGEKVGGIRISHLSGLDEPKTFTVTVSRTKRTKVTIRPIVDTLSPEDQKFIAEATKELTAAASLEVLNGYGQTLKTKSKNVQDTLRPVYAKRLEALAPKGESP